MSKRILAIFLSLVMVIGLTPAMAFAETEPVEDYGKSGKDYVEGQAIVCLKGTTSTAKFAKQKGMGDFEFESLMKIDGESASRAKASKAKSAAADSKVLALVDSDEKTADLIKKLEQNPQVEFAEPNYRIETCGMEPADPRYPYQWHLQNRLNMGSPAAQAPAVDANVSKAWEKADFSDNKKKPVIAVLDSGVDYTHPDLKDVMWDDGLKIPALTAMGGGKYGYNACGEFDSEGKPTGEKSDDPMDRAVGHGTHCAGIIAAQWNDKGIAGVSSHTEIMALRHISIHGGQIANALKGYAYIQTAAENGVNIAAVNNSWGTAYNEIMPQSVSVAANTVGERYGIISCFAAGNDNTNNDLNTISSPGGEYIIQVGALDSTGAAASFSSYGKRTVDVFAPGTNILSTTTTDQSVPENQIQEEPQYLPQFIDKDQTWFYEDFEDEDDQIALRLLDEDENVVESAKAVSGPGAQSSRGLQLPLDAIKEGEHYSIEIVVPKEKLAEIGAKDPIYMAFQGGVDNAVYGGYWFLGYMNKDGDFEWLNNGPKEPYMPGSDHNWNQASSCLDNPDFSQIEEEEIRFVLQPPRISSTHMNEDGQEKLPVFRLDNVGFGKSAEPYRYADGTSMAAPVATGLAGLLAGSTDLAPEEIIARIKGGVNRRDAIGLKDKSVSDGFIDAAAAFDEKKCVPVLNELQIQENSAVLKGYFFGDAKGTLSVGGKTIDASKWTDREITFPISEEMTGMQEVRVVRAGMNAEMDYGKNFFTVKQDNFGFRSLTAPNNSYGKMEGGEVTLTSADCLPIDMAAADGKIAYVSCIIENEKMAMELYDIAEDSWKQIDLPKDMVFRNIAELYSLTAGKDKLYLSYASDKDTINLGIYDLKTDTWKTASKTDLQGWETLEVYQDKLLAVGGQRTAAGGKKVPISAVKILDPNTGKVIGKLPDMPEARCGVKVSASGDKLYVCGSYDIFSEDLQREGWTKYGNIMAYDGKNWAVSEEPFFSEEYSEFDKDQTLNYGLGAADNGLFAVGPVKDLDGENAQDTWFYDAEKNTWSAREDLRYCTVKTELNTGVCYDGSFYALSWTGLQKEPVIFRELQGISYTAPKDQLITQLAAPKIKAESGLTSAKLSWNKVSGATGYEIYRASSKNGTYKRVFTTTKQSGTNTGLTTGKTYYYKVRAYKKSGNATIYGKYSGWLAVTPKPAAPTFKLSALDNGAKVTWNKASGASGYKIYRATSKNGTYKLIKTAKSTDRSYTSKYLKNKKTYYYKVRAYKVVNGKNVYSRYSIVKSIRTK